MKKEIFYDKNAIKELKKFKKEVQREFKAHIRDFIVILHFFQKKTQKTPLKNINLAKERLRRYE